MDTFAQKLQYLFVAMLMVVSLFLLALLVAAAKDIAGGGSLQGKNAGRNTSSLGAQMLETPNAVTGSLSTLVRESGEIASSAASGAWSAVTSVGDGIASIGNGIVGGYQAVGNTVANIGQSATNQVVHAAVTTLNLPSTAYASVITPGGDIEDYVIETYPSAVHATHTEVQVATVQTANVSIQTMGPGAVWPIHGTITTLFGVPHWPYQPTHTGIDISTGQRSGVTPVVSFKPGRVVQVIHSSRGLGNHVVVDHGAGVTSVYAHLYSTAVHVGQAVDSSTELGREGSTGASTGTHLHFEIRINGSPVNPQQYIGFNP